MGSRTSLAGARTGKWRANFQIPNYSQILCEMWGMEATDFARYAIEELIRTFEKQYGNLETCCVAHYLQSYAYWREIAEDCDDYTEFVHKIAGIGISRTPRDEVSLKDKRIARGRLNPLIRAIRKDPKNEKKQEGSA
jgi:hypothetical protein